MYLRVRPGFVNENGAVVDTAPLSKHLILRD
jgi:hypothetical protein